MPFYRYDGALAVDTAAPVSNLYGSSGADTLTGSGLAESLWGGEGDLMTGGGGDDTYYVRSVRDRVVEAAGGGVDKIVAWQSINLANYANIENVSVTGDGLYAAGNAVDNIVQGGAGKEQLYGGLGQDVLVGGSGSDVFIVYKGEGNDVIQDFSVADDVVRLKAGFTHFSQVQARLSQVGADVRLDLGDGAGLMFRNLGVSQLTAANFQLQLDPAKLGSLSFDDGFSAPLSIWDPQSNPGGLWRPDYGYQGTQGVGSYTLVSNSELQIYTSPYFRDHNGDFAESPFVSNPDGTLSIVAKPSSNGAIFGYGYTSGLITTQPTFAQTYGYFEMRADVPKAAGAWPAFWLLPKDGSWPPELDVMEVLAQDPDASWTTSHSGLGGAHTSSGVAAFTPATADGMHTYGVLWTASDLVWYIDGVEAYRAATPADMNKPMFMLANLALGGWAGAVDAAALPAEFKIDYIRAYALPGVTVTTVVGPGGGASPPPPPQPPTYANSLFSLADSASSTVQISGSQKPDNLLGTAGADLIDGKGNTDTMRGGLGDDTYVVDRTGDSVVEGVGAGVDTVRSAAYSYTLGLNVENLRLVASGGQIGVGNALANKLTANDAGSTLSGLAGDDVLVAGRGADVLSGGGDRDIFQFSRLPSSAAGHVTDFARGADMIDLRGLFAAVGYSGSDPIVDGYLRLVADAQGGTQIWFDGDGAGAAKAALVTTVDGVHPAMLDGQNDWFFR